MKPTPLDAQAMQLDLDAARLVQQARAAIGMATLLGDCVTLVAAYQRLNQSLRTALKDEHQRHSSAGSDGSAIRTEAPTPAAENCPDTTGSLGAGREEERASVLARNTGSMPGPGRD